MKTLVWVCALGVGIAALGDPVNVIYQHNSNLVQGTHYEIFGPPENRVRILAGVQGETFEFEAALEENGQYVDPGDIRVISTLDDAGPVEITIVGHNGHTYGARDVGTIALDATGVDGAIGDVTLSRHLATLDTVAAKNIAGHCLIGDQNDPQTGHVLNPIVLGCFSGTLECNTLHDFTVLPGCPGADSPTLIVHAGYDRTLTIGGLTESPPLKLLHIGENEGDMVTGTVTVNTDVEEVALVRVAGQGQVRIGGSVLVKLEVANGLRDEGLVEVSGNSKYTNIQNGIGPAAVARFGSVGPQIHNTCFVRCNEDPNAPDAAQLDGLLDIVGDAADFHVYGLTRGQVHVGGNVQIAGFSGDLLGACHVEGDVTREVVIGYEGDEWAGLASLVGALLIDGNFYHHPSNSCGAEPPYNCDFTIYHGDLSGTLVVGGDFEAYARIPDGSISGTVVVNGSFNDGLLAVAGILDDPNDLLQTGHIRIHDSLRGTANITIETAYAIATEFITVSWDGWQEGVEEFWDPNAKITVNGVACGGDTPSLNIRRCTGCLADLDNSGAADFDDISPFVLALGDPAAYSLANPGLGGIAGDGFASGPYIYHGDLDCDGDLDFDDAGLLPNFLGQPCVSDCPGGGEGLSAQQLAAGMLAHVPSQRHGRLREIAAEVADRLSGPRRAYWLAVRQYPGE